MNPSLWLYAIHSKNIRMIHLLESHCVMPPNNDFEICLIESIKCHHNEIFDYIENNLIQHTEEERRSDELFTSVFQYQNYEKFVSNIENDDDFFFSSFYIDDTLVKLFIEKKEEDIKESIIANDYTIQKAAEENEIKVMYYLLMNENSIQSIFFEKNDKIKRIVIPHSVTVIEDSAFKECSSLAQISIPSSVTSIGRHAFKKCSSLTHIIIPSSVTVIEDFTFNECISLKQIIIPSSINSI